MNEERLAQNSRLKEKALVNRMGTLVQKERAD
jgi:hypothetical protein